MKPEIARHGLDNRISVMTGDMFLDAWPEANVVLLSNVLHNWNEPEVEELLAQAPKALATGGLMVIHDAFVSDDKAGPLEPAEYSALLMNINQGKCCSAAEYAGMMECHGFEPGSYHDTIPKRGFMISVRK